MMGPGARIAVDDVSLTNVSHATLSDKDWKYLARARGGRYNRVDPQRFVAACHRGLASLWRAEGPGLEVLIGLEVQVVASGARVLSVAIVGGKGYFKHLEKVLACVKEIASYYDCEAIIGTVERRGMLRKYSPLGIKPVCEAWSLQV